MSKRILLIIAVVVIAAGAHPEPAPKPTRFVDPSAKARVDLAKKAIDLLTRHLKEGKGDDNLVPYILFWQTRHVDSRDFLRSRFFRGNPWTVPVGTCAIDSR